MEKIILTGGGGHCKVVINAILLAKNYEIAGIIDLEEKIGLQISSIPVIGTDKDLEKYFAKDIKNCFITVGSTGNLALRIKLYNKAKEIGYKFPNIIHPDTIISEFAKIGDGNFIAPGVIINSSVTIGSFCIINTGSIIEHDCKISNFVHIAPGVTLSGGVIIGANSHVGTGSSVIQNLKIGKNTLIGAGSVVVKNIGDNLVAYGNPCKEKKGNEK